MSFVRPVLLVLRTWHAEGPLFPSRIIHHTICHCSFANSCFCSEWLYHAIMFVCFQHHHSLHQMPEHILVAVHFTSLYANPLKFILSYDSYFFFSFYYEVCTCITFCLPVWEELIQSRGRWGARTARCMFQGVLCGFRVRLMQYSPRQLARIISWLSRR